MIEDFQTIRVITDIGFGTVEAPGGCLSLCPAFVEVTMDNPADPLGAIQRFRKEAVYEFGDFAVVRVASVDGLGVGSNILVFSSRNEAAAFYEAPCPLGETRFFLDLTAGTFEMSCRIGSLSETCARIEVWLDRWGANRTVTFSVMGSDVLGTFDRDVEQLAGTGDGVLVWIVLDFATKRIYRFALAAAACRGVVFSKKFYEESV